VQTFLGGYTYHSISRSTLVCAHYLPTPTPAPHTYPPAWACTHFCMHTAFAFFFFFFFFFSLRRGLPRLRRAGRDLRSGSRYSPLLWFVGGRRTTVTRCKTWRGYHHRERRLPYAIRHLYYSSGDRHTDFLQRYHFARVRHGWLNTSYGPFAPRPCCYRRCVASIRYRSPVILTTTFTTRWVPFNDSCAWFVHAITGPCLLRLPVLHILPTTCCRASLFSCAILPHTSPHLQRSCILSCHAPPQAFLLECGDVLHLLQWEEGGKG